MAHLAGTTAELRSKHRIESNPLNQHTTLLPSNERLEKTFREVTEFLGEREKFPVF